MAKQKEKSIKNKKESNEINNKEIDKYFKEKQKDIESHLAEKEAMLIEDMTEKINSQIEFNVSRKMKELEQKFIRGKNIKIIRRDIIIIILLSIVGYFGYCLYDTDYFNIRTKEIDNNSSNNIDTDKKEEFGSDYYINKYHYLVDNMQIEDPSILSLYQDKVTSENINNELKLKIAYKNLISDKKEENKETIIFKASDLLDSAKVVFGSKVKLDNNVFSYNNTKFMYYADNYLGFKEESSSTNTKYKIYAGSEKDKNLIFEVAIAKTEEDKLLNIDNEVVCEDYQNDDLTNYLDKLSKYRYTFIRDNNTYIFSNIEKI